DENFAAPNGDAAIYDVAAGVDGPLGRDLGVVGPEFLSGGRFHREDFAPGGSEVHHTIDDDGSGFLTTTGVEIHVPGESQLPDVLVVDLLQWAEALLAISTAVTHPVAWLPIGIN